MTETIQKYCLLTLDGEIDDILQHIEQQDISLSEWAETLIGSVLNNLNKPIDIAIINVNGSIIIDFILETNNPSLMEQAIKTLHNITDISMEPNFKFPIISFEVYNYSEPVDGAPNDNTATSPAGDTISIVLLIIAGCIICLCIVGCIWYQRRKQSEDQQIIVSIMAKDKMHSHEHMGIEMEQLEGVKSISSQSYQMSEPGTVPTSGNMEDTDVPDPEFTVITEVSGLNERDKDQEENNIEPAAWKYWDYWNQDNDEDLDPKFDDVECDGNVKICKAVQNVIDIIINDMKTESNEENLDMDIILNYYNHCIKSHDTSRQIEWIYDQIVVANNDKICDINKCSKIEMNGDDVNENILKKMHNHYMHCFDIGYQLQSDDKQYLDEESKSDMLQPSTPMTPNSDGENIKVDIESHMRQLKRIKKISRRNGLRFGTDLSATSRKFNNRDREQSVTEDEAENSKEDTMNLFDEFMDEYKMEIDHGDIQQIETQKQGEDDDIALNMLANSDNEHSKSERIAKQNKANKEYWSDHSSDYSTESEDEMKNNEDIDELERERRLIQEYLNSELKIV